MTDTPPASNPPSRLDIIKNFIGDLARPFAIYVLSLAGAIAIVRIAWALAARVDSWEGAAIFIAAVAAFVGGIFGAKAWEVTRTGKQAADVAIAQTNTPSDPTRTP